MSSVSISQVLQITAAKADDKPPLNSPQGDEFERILSRISGASEQRASSAGKKDEAPEAEQALADDSGEDAATTSDDQSVTTDVVTAVDGDEETASAEDLLSDEVELSEAAVLAVITQVPVAAEYPVKVVDAIVDEELTTAAEAVAPEAAAIPQAAVSDFSKTFDAIPETTGNVTDEPVVVDPATKIGPEQPAPTKGTGEVVPVDSFATQAAVVETAPKVSAKIQKAATQQAKEDAVSETDEAPVGEAKTIEQPAKPETLAVAAPVQPELIANGEAKVNADEKPVPELQAIESSHIRHDNQDNRSHLTNAADTLRADANTLADTDLVSTTDRVRFVQRVSRAFQTAQSRDGIVQLRLSPPELGSMKIAIITQQGVLSAKVETETAAARNVILDNLPALRERLADQQIRLERFDVDVRRDGSQSPGNREAADRGSRDSNNNPNSNRVRQASVAVPRIARVVGGNSSLDVRI